MSEQDEDVVERAERLLAAATKGVWRVGVGNIETRDAGRHHAVLVHTDDCCVVEEVIPEGYREVDLAELSVGGRVLVRDDRGEPTLVTVASRAHVAPEGTAEATLGYLHPTEDGGTKFTPLTKETYVKVRSTK